MNVDHDSRDTDSGYPNLNFPPSLCLSPLDTSDQAFGTTEQISRFGIAGRVWEAAYVLEQYISSNAYEFDPPFPPSSSTSNLTLLELGSGTGISASTIAASLGEGDLIVATDLSEVVPLLESNLASRGDRVLVRPLAWGNAQQAENIARELAQSSRYVTHIVASDLVYFPELLAPLLRSLIQVSSSHDPVRRVAVIMAYKIRSLAKETPFWQAFGLWFTFEPVLSRKLSPSSTPDEVQWERFNPSPDPTFIFVAKRRKESFNWTVPQGDHDLLAGVGVWGGTSPKGDDTFETLLLMSLQE